MTARPCGTPQVLLGSGMRRHMRPMTCGRLRNNQCLQEPHATVVCPPAEQGLCGLSFCRARHETEQCRTSNGANMQVMLQVLSCGFVEQHGLHAVAEMDPTRQANTYTLLQRLSVVPLRNSAGKRHRTLHTLHLRSVRTGDRAGNTRPHHCCAAAGSLHKGAWECDRAGVGHELEQTGIDASNSAPLL